MCCNKVGNKQRKRCYHNNDTGNADIECQHDDQCSQNGHNTGKELCKAHQKAIRKLIHIRDHTTDDLTVRMRIYIFQRQILQLVKGFLPDIPYYMIGYFIIDLVHDPLQNSRDQNKHTNRKQIALDRSEMHTGLYDLVNGTADQDRYI